MRSENVTGEYATTLTPVPASSACEPLIHRIDAVLGSSTNAGYLRLVTAGLEAQHEDGSWGPRDDPALIPCYTAQTIGAVQRIAQARINLDSPLESLSYFDALVTRGASWLVSSWQDGFLGEDLWDRTEVARNLIVAGVPETHPLIQDVVGESREAIRLGVATDSFWAGPGTLGNMIGLFSTVGDKDHILRACSQLWDFQDSNSGKFYVSDDQIGHAPAEWHTACALLGLSMAGSAAVEPHREAVARAWLKASQHSSSGAWYFNNGNNTCYATMQSVAALVHREGEGSPEARRGAEWFVKRWTDARPSPNQATILMGMAAVSLSYRQDLFTTIAYVDLSEIRNALAHEARSAARLRSRISDSAFRFGLARPSIDTGSDQVALSHLATIEKELGMLRSDLSDERLRSQKYILRMTNRDVAFWGLLLAVIGIILAVL